MTDKEVIDYLRSKGHALLAAADALEGKPAESVGSSFSPIPSANPGNESAGVNIIGADVLRDYLKAKSGRPADIAKALGASEDNINNLINNPFNGFVRVSRGWIKNHDDPSLLEIANNT